jgi:hypothetical protein
VAARKTGVSRHRMKRRKNPRNRRFNLPFPLSFSKIPLVISPTRTMPVWEGMRQSRTACLVVMMSAHCICVG